LLLDEATSALDAESERVVQGALETLHDRSYDDHHRAPIGDRARSRSHRRDGSPRRIVAIGSHEALVADNPLYARLAALQFTDGPGTG
jgi:ATP-binding cassette subfamily B protein